MNTKIAQAFEFDLELNKFAITPLSGAGGPWGPGDPWRDELIFEGSRVGPRGDCYVAPTTATFTLLEEEASRNEERINAIVSRETFARIQQDASLGGPFPLTQENLDRSRLWEMTGLNPEEMDELVRECRLFRDIQERMAEELASANFPDRRRFPGNPHMRELVRNDVMWLHNEGDANKEVIASELALQRGLPKTLEEAFVEAIAEEPAELVHRLAFSDWLEDRDAPGDKERAEWIRLHCALSEMPEDTPERRTAMNRILDIMEDWGKVWAERIGCSEDSVHWEGGFIEGVRMNLNAFLDSSDVFLEPVRNLSVPELTRDSVRGVSLSNLRNIERLYLDRVDYPVLEEMLFGSAALASLKVLSIPVGSVPQSVLARIAVERPELEIRETL